MTESASDPGSASRQAAMAARVCALVAETLACMHPIRPLPEVTPDSDLDADLHSDEIDRLCIACVLDETFGIELPDRDVERWRTVRDVIATVAAHAP